MVVSGAYDGSESARPLLSSPLSAVTVIYSVNTNITLCVRETDTVMEYYVCGRDRFPFENLSNESHESPATDPK